MTHFVLFVSRIATPPEYLRQSTVTGTAFSGLSDADSRAAVSNNYVQ